MKDKFSKWIKICPHCIRFGKLEKARQYSHQAEDPRLLKMLNKECFVFHTVSLDVFQEVFVLAHGRARSKPTYSVAILIVAHLVSGSVCLDTMDDDAKATSVAKGQDTVALRYRMPRYLIMDSGLLQ